MDAAGEPVYYGLALSAWLKIGAVALLMAALFRFNLARLWSKTNPFTGEANWQHAMILPVIGLYYLYVWREDLLRPKAGRLSPLRLALGGWAIAATVVWGTFVQLRNWSLDYLAAKQLPEGAAGVVTGYLGYGLVALSLISLGLVVWLKDELALKARLAALTENSAGWFGAYVMVWGILFSFWGIWPGQNDFFKDVGMVFALFGVVLMLTSWRVMRTAWFPVLFLLAGIPWPDQVYSKLAGPLQQLAAKVAVHVLTLTGVEAAQQGTKIVMMGYGGALRTLNVAEACAGLKALMTFVAVSATVAFLSARPLWQKLIISASAVPIAIACNVMRVSGQGLLDHYVSPKLSQGFAHQFVGLVMLIPGFFLILLLCWVLDHVFIDVVDDEERAKQSRVNPRRMWRSAAPPSRSPPSPEGPPRPPKPPPSRPARRWSRLPRRRRRLFRRKRTISKSKPPKRETFPTPLPRRPRL